MIEIAAAALVEKGKEIQHHHRRKNGEGQQQQRMHTGKIDDAYAGVKEVAVPLTLEEVFTYEMEALGYAFGDLLPQ